MRSMKRRILMEEAIVFVSLLILLHIPLTYSTEINFISDSQFLTAEDTLVSQDGIFVLGFFKPNGTENTYLGIWYKKISVQTVVWVANRDRPFTGASLGVVKIDNPGNLVIMNTVTNHVMWSSNTTSSGNTIAKLLDTGNLVVTDGNQNKILWMSFDYPTDTLLPGMTLGRNLLTGQEWHLSSWKNSQDPAPGEFTWIIDTHGYPQHLLKQGAVVKFRGGPWNGERFSGYAYSHNTIFTYNMVINKTEVAYTYNLVNSSSVLSRATLGSSGKYDRFVWLEEGKTWQVSISVPTDICDTYNICGAYGRCIMMILQTCVCLDEKKFMPRNPKNWERADWHGGCVRKTPLDCKNRSDGFKRYSNVKLPDTQTSWFNMSMTLKECKTVCLKNCTCVAYANTDIRGEGSGCLLWFNDLIDIKLVSEGMGGQDIFVRMASSDLVDQSVSTNKGGTKIKIILMVVFLAVFVLGLSSAWFCYKWRKRHNAQPTGEGDSIELPLFSFSTIQKATASFSLDNKLGEGGFGPVYKGILEGGEIAVKRLSHTSSQGLDEFKNEVICISKLQHRNLVKLLGCSIEGDEKLLIYEYMPNKSLDSFIFDKMRSTLLDWTKRFHIIEGIARGILYLHQDSRLRIIHRDLKASNILLDLDMNPKISDFGIARSFGGNENEANTERVVGTYGYMSPEYARDGLFSTKSDVFSFGVLMLEIISGKKNRGFVHSDHSNNLIGHAWTMHNEGRSLELVDTNIEETINRSEVLRSIEVGLLCVQQNPEDRPNMSSVVRMLGNELHGALKKPKQPAFFIERNILGVDSSSSSTNYLTVTEIIAR